MVNYIIRKEKYMQYPGKELSLEEKEQRLYHYTSYKSFTMIWLSQTLKFGTVTDMNDIFEHNFASQCHSLNDIKYLNSYHEEKKKYKQISLTMDYDTYTQGCMSPMMWGQYADKGNGVCIEFDYNKLMDNIKPSMMHNAIDYVYTLPEPPIITQEVTTDFDSFFKEKQKELFFTKHKSWSNENEYRIVSKEDFLIIEGAITAIYVSKYNSTESSCIEMLLKKCNDVSYNIVRFDSMPNVGTYQKIVDYALFKEMQEHNQKNIKHITMKN